MKITPERFTSPTRMALAAATVLAVIVGAAPIAAKNAQQTQIDEAATVAQSQNNAYDHDQLRVYPAILKNELAYDAVIAADEARKVIASSASVTDVAALSGKVEALSSVASLSSSQISNLIQDTRATSAKTSASAAAEVARQAAEAAHAAAAQEAEIAPTRDPNGARALGASLAASIYGWGAGEFTCLDHLWTKESNWRYNAVNAGGGATGIPQALPGSKMASFGSDYLTNPATQIKWGLDYVKRSYGSPCSAWSHSVANGWY